jgi:hypothetical protein
LAKAEKYQESAKALNKIAKSSKMSDEEKIAKIVSDLGFSEDTARKALTPDAFGNIGVAAYSLTNNNANIRRIKEQIADIQKRYNLEKGEGVTMRLFMLKGGKAKGSPTGFLTNEDGNVFPVFGGNYRPKNLEKHREIVQKIHDNTKDPGKKAKHAEYLKSLGGGAERPAPGEPDISKLSPWKKGRFEIQKAASRAEGAKQFKESVPGWTSKHFGIHKAPQGRKDAKPYTLTHLHTGTAIGVRSGTLEAAQAYASALEHHGGNAWAFTDSAEPPAARSDYAKWFKDAEATSDSIRDQRNASRVEKARQNYREVGDKIATSDVKVSHGGKSVWDKERASEVITAGGRFVTDGSMMILEPTSSAGANPMNITEKDLRPFWDDTINAATSRNEAKLDEEALYDKSETFAKHGRERIPFAQLRDDSEAYPVNVAKIRWIQKRTGATSMRMVPHGDHARIVLYQGSRPVAIAMSRRKSDDMKKGRDMVLRMLKGEGKRQPSGFITVGGGEEKGGHVIPVFGHAPSDYEGKVTVTTAGGKEYDIDEDKHEAIKAKIKRHQAEAAGQGKLFTERGKPTEKAKEAGSREAPPKKEPQPKSPPASTKKPASDPVAAEKAKAAQALYDHVTDYGAGHMGDAFSNLGDKKRILSDLQDSEHEHADLVEKHWDHAKSEAEDRIRKTSDEQTDDLSDEEKEAQGLPVGKKPGKPAPRESAKPEPSPEDAIKAKVDAKLAEVAERSKALGEKFKAERAEKAKKEADAASPEEIKAYLEKATDAYLKTRPLEKEKAEAFKAKQSSEPAKKEEPGSESWGRPYKNRLMDEVHKEKQAVRALMNSENTTPQQMKDFQSIGVRLEGQFDKASFDEAVERDRGSLNALRSRLEGGKADEPVTVKPAGPKEEGFKIPSKEEVEAKKAESTTPKEADPKSRESSLGWFGHDQAFDAMGKDGKPVDRIGSVLGHFGVSKHGANHVITHIPTGAKVASFKTQMEAKTFTEAMHHDSKSDWGALASPKNVDLSYQNDISQARAAAAKVAGDSAAYSDKALRGKEGGANTPTQAEQSKAIIDKVNSDTADREVAVRARTLKQHIDAYVKEKSAKYPGRGPTFNEQVKRWKRSAEDEWKGAILKEAEKNRLPNATLKAWADAYGEESIPNTFRGKYERGAGGHPGGDPYEPTGVRKKNDEERAARVADRKGDSKPTIQERIDATRKKVEESKGSDK